MVVSSPSPFIEGPKIDAGIFNPKATSGIFKVSIESLSSLEAIQIWKYSRFAFVMYMISCLTIIRVCMDSMLRLAYILFHTFATEFCIWTVETKIKNFYDMFIMLSIESN